jgi:hypothetical protein
VDEDDGDAVLRPGLQPVDGEPVGLGGVGSDTGQQVHDGSLSLTGSRAVGGA